MAVFLWFQSPQSVGDLAWHGMAPAASVTQMIFQVVTDMVHSLKY